MIAQTQQPNKNSKLTNHADSLVDKSVEEKCKFGSGLNNNPGKPK